MREPTYDASGRAICCQACLLGLNGEAVVLHPRPFCGHRLCPDCLAERPCARCVTAARRPGSWEAAEEREHAPRCGCDYCRIRRQIDAGVYPEPHYCRQCKHRLATGPLCRECMEEAIRPGFV
jgi:hypothetical protein